MIEIQSWDRISTTANHVGSTVQYLGDELVVVELFPGLHDPDDAGLNLVLPVLINLLLGLVPLWLCLTLAGARLLDLHPDSIFFITIRIFTKTVLSETI